MWRRLATGFLLGAAGLTPELALVIMTKPATSVVRHRQRCWRPPGRRARVCPGVEAESMACFLRSTRACAARNLLSICGWLIAGSAGAARDRMASAASAAAAANATATSAAEAACSSIITWSAAARCSPAVTGGLRHGRRLAGCALQGRLNAHGIGFDNPQRLTRRYLDGFGWTSLKTALR